MTTRFLAAALIALACATSAPAASFRFYVDVDGTAINVPRTSGERPIALEVPDLAPFPMGTQVQGAKIPPDVAPHMLAAVMTYLHEVRPVVSIRWAKRVEDPPAPTFTTSTAPPTSTSTTLAPPPATSTSSTTTPTTPGTSTTSTTSPPPPPVGRDVPAVVGSDVSVRLADDDQCVWWRGRTADQLERSAILLATSGRFMPEGLRYLETMGSFCASKVSGASSRLQAMDARLRTDYRTKGPLWQVNRGCRDYGFARDMGLDIQACSTASQAARRLCAVLFNMNGDLLGWADMRVERVTDPRTGVTAAECVRGSRDVIVVPADGEEDKAVKMVGLLDLRKPIPVLDSAQRGALTVTHVEHVKVDDYYCGDGPPPTPGLVKKAHAAFVATAHGGPGVDSETHRHAFTMDDFTGSWDSRWTPQDRCDLSRLKGIAHARWAACFLLPDRKKVWPCLLEAAIDHTGLHRLGATQGGGLVRFTCGKPGHIVSCPAMTPPAWLKCMTGDTPGCRPPWVPEPSTWREVVVTPRL